MTADKQLKAYIDRVLRLKEEQDTIGDDIREIYAEAKAAGYDKTIMGKLVAHLRRELKQGAGAVAEAESIFDTYLNAYQRASGMQVAIAHTHASEAHDPETGEILEDIDPRLAQTIVTGMQTETGRKALIAAVDIMIACEDAEEQNAPERPSHNDEPSPEVGPQAEASPAGTGAGTLADREGRHEGEAASVDLPTNSEIDPTEDREEDHSLDGNAGANTGGRHVAAKANRAATAGALVQVAPATNGIVFETCPPKPMKSLSYAHCFPELSKTEYQCLAGDIALNGVLEPIVRMGDVIVDGWNRYNAARSLGIEYPVTSYGGDDVLLDVIRWQRSSRDWTPQQERKIAAALAKVVPHRSEDIAAAFHLVDEEEPA
ncbi:GapR family DNA-binding domain-containing protein [Rhizobium leguminosarum]|uniref:GapR family DNA-binding domain-containing protein n=1 Tax=Rhizobium leguminosarum TaxID=384 RepID=UPI00036C938B|nr:GapR family DNA-binding domain-containing protein [Rhizobium leguminosarum]